MRAVGLAVGLMVAASLLGGCGASGGEGVSADVEEAARGAFPDYDTGAADCPAGTTVEGGEAFRCTLEIEGQEVTVEVTPEGDSALRLDPVEALVPLDRVEAAIVADLGGAEVVDVDCGERAVIVREPGDTFDCRADAGDGAEATIVVTVEDAEGNTSYEIT